MKTFLSNSAIKWVLNAVAAGTTNQDTESVDMQSGESVTFIAKFGTLTASAVTGLKLQGSNNNSSWTDLAGTAQAIAVADTGKAIAVEAVNPTFRYVRGVVTRGTANAVIDGVVAIKTFAPRVAVVTHDATLAGSKTVAGAIAGTA
jgi:hypothetical protein